MPTVAPYQGNFNAGEVSDVLQGRVEAERYKQGLAVCLNAFPMTQGPVTRRGGTRYIATTKDSTKQSVLVPFQFSVTQAYILEFGDLYVRFYENYGQILSGGAAYEIVSPYAVADIQDIDFTQSDDVLYLFHEKYPAQKLERIGNTNWQFVLLNLLNGPYLNANTTNQTLIWANPVQTVGTPVGVSFGTQASDGVFLVVSSTATFNNNDVLYSSVPGCPGVFPINILSSTTLTLLGGIFNGTPGTGFVSRYSDGYITVTSGNTTITAVANDGNGQAKLTASNFINCKSGDTIYSTVTGYVGTFTVTVLDTTHFVLNGSTFAATGTGTIYQSVFQSTDVGRNLALCDVVNGWYHAKITAFIHPGICNILFNLSNNLGVPVPMTAATTNWRFGLYGKVNGYPKCGIFHEDRLVLAGCPATPERIDGSRTSDYENFQGFEDDSSVVASDAYSFSLVSNDVNAIQWVMSDEHGMPVGTAGAEWVVRPDQLNAALSATNVSAKKVTQFGSANIRPVMAGKSTIYVQRTLQKIREMSYFYQIDGFESQDMTELAEHITTGGVVGKLSYVKEPQPVIWALRDDGTLIGLTFARTMDSLKAGWHRHILGGRSDIGGTQPIVESIASIPSPDGLQDDLWMIVKRIINGQTVRTIEHMTKPLSREELPYASYFLDCGATFDNPITITNVTNANPAVVTAAAHGFSNGDKVRIEALIGMGPLNGPTFTVAGVTTNTFQLSGINSTSYPSYIQGGSVRKQITQISGLTWLKNETISVLADGAVQPDVTVSNAGVVTLQNPAGTVHLGYGYNTDIKLLRIDAGAADGTSIGKLRRIHKVALMLNRTLGLQFGTDFNKLDTITFRSSEGLVGRAPELFSGIIRMPIEADFDTENQICLRQSQPLPFTLLAVAPQMDTEDDG